VHQNDGNNLLHETAGNRTIITRHTFSDFSVREVSRPRYVEDKFPAKVSRKAVKFNIDPRKSDNNSKSDFGEGFFAGQRENGSSGFDSQ
jgi:hypothetical protein